MHEFERKTMHRYYLSSTQFTSTKTNHQMITKIWMQDLLRIACPLRKRNMFNKKQTNIKSKNDSDIK